MTLTTAGRRPGCLLSSRVVRRDGAWAWYRSDDEGRSWSYYAAIQNDYSHADRVDLIPVGMDVAIVFSWESWTTYGSSRHNVWFQWWRWDGNANWNPTAPRL